MGQTKDGLTSKQIECLRLVGTKQMTSKEIAIELGISPPTVDQRLDAARRKLGVTTRREAARKFMLIDRSKAYEQILYEPIGIDKNNDSATFREPAFDELLSPESTMPPGAGNRSFVKSSDEMEHLKPTNRVVPPIGGKRHNLAKTDIIKSVLITAFFSMACLSAMVMIILGIMRILD